MVGISGLSALAICLRNIDFAADNGLDAGVAGSRVEVDRPVHVAMVCQGNAGHAKLARTCDETGNATHPVQQAVLGVNVEMNEGRSHRRDYSTGSPALEGATAP